MRRIKQTREPSLKPISEDSLLFSLFPSIRCPSAKNPLYMFILTIPLTFPPASHPALSAPISRVGQQWVRRSFATALRDGTAAPDGVDTSGGIQNSGCRQGKSAKNQIPAKSNIKLRFQSKSELYWWGKVDSNHRSRRQQIYSLPPLATREFPHETLWNFALLTMELVDGLEPPTC